MRLSRAHPIAVLLAAVTLTGVGCSSGGSPASPSGPGSASPSVTITVSSAAFEDGGPIPAQFTCDGAGISPPLQWSGVPAGTGSLALVVDDPDAPAGTFVHWALAGLPGTDGTLAADAGTAGAGAGTVSALNSGGRPGWTPPCPPSGTHRYRFTVYALPAGAPFAAGAPTTAAVKAITAAATSRGTLTGIYARRST